MEEEKKTKAELKAEKKAEIAAVKKAKAEEKILKKSEAKAAKKARAEERKKSKIVKNGDEETSKPDSIALSEEHATVKNNGNRNRLIVIALVATIPSIIVIILYVTGVIVKDHKVTKIKVTNNDLKLISDNENEVLEFEMSSFFVPLRSGNGIVKLRIALDNLRGDWKKRILMNPGRYRGIVIEAIEEDLVEDIKSRKGQEAVLGKIESRLKNLMGNNVFGGIIVREFNVL